MDPKNISILDYTYHLPEEKIAKHPLAERDASKLLIYKDGNISEDVYRNIAAHIPENSLLIFNNTKVAEARIIFQKSTGAQIEIFCLEPDEYYGNISIALLQQKKVFWKCLIGGASKWKHGQVLEKRIKHNDNEIILNASFVRKENDYFLVELSWQPENFSFAEILHFAGNIPLPPYIKRETELSDIERYQTVYAKNNGSVAAPTAGLHFTDNIFSELTDKHILKDNVTLHVGAGTFMPVKAETLKAHNMHSEFIEVEMSTIIFVLENLRKGIFAVGTTSLRTIESLYWLGVKTILQPDIDLKNFVVLQWDAYELTNKNIATEQSLKSLIDWMKKNNMQRIITRTQLLIAPGYQFKIIKALITNFHQPQSTLLLLVAALIGRDWKEVYSYALKNDFRFLSYGDGCLLFGSRGV